MAGLASGARSMRPDGRRVGLRDTLRGVLGVASYPALGYLVRKRAWDPAATDVDLAGKVCLVTGGSQGLGYGIASALAARGATVVIVCRDVARGEAARRSIAEVCGADRVVVAGADVSSVRAVRELAATLRASHRRLDVLVNNAGAIFEAPRRSADGLELTFATNVLGGFAVTHSLLALLRAGAPSRIVHVGSAAQYLQRLDVAALLGDGRTHVGELVYARTKRAVSELSARWAEQLAGQGITSNCMHPGLTSTPGVARAFPVYQRAAGAVLRTLEQGADTAVWLAVAEAAAGESGGFWFDRERQPEHVLPWTRSARGEIDRLWAACERWVA
jgi:NAD(P)-dependent dehydrogenase (short-subunit alcohol dehydrogenase family)